jgi:integrase-like protein
MAAGPTWLDEEPVFTDALGRPLDPNAVSKRFKVLAKAVGLNGSVHTLRHSAATALLGSGVDVRTAAARLGHDPSVLLKTYAHHVASRDEAAASAVGGLSSARPREVMFAQTAPHDALAPGPRKHERPAYGPFWCGPWRDRTSDLGIKSPLLYQLS